MKASIDQRIGKMAVLVVGLGLVGGEAAEAQEGLHPDALFIAMGVAGTATGKLDEQLASRGYPTFGQTAVAPSLGVIWQLAGGLMVSAEWSGLVWQEKPLGELEVGLGGGHGTLGAGYAFETSRRSMVYPRLE